jgi:hypothetical protein
MFGTPYNAPIDASVFFWVWLYSINPHKNNDKKVRGVCDGYTRGSKTMVRGVAYAPTPQQIDFRLQITLSALLSEYLWHANVTNTFTKVERLSICITCAAIKFSKIGGRHGTVVFHSPPDMVVPVLKNLQGHHEGPHLWVIHFHAVLIALKINSTTHAPCLYHSIFNDEFVLFLRMEDDFSIACNLKEMYSKLYGRSM